MTKLSPRRNQRSASFKLVHGIQIFLWLAICMWLLYQMKQFYDNKKVYVKSFAKMPEKMQNGDEVLQLGRKHLHVGRHGKIGTKMGKHKESEGLRKGGGYHELEEDDDEEREEVSEEVEYLIDEEDRDVDGETEEQETEEKHIEIIR